MPIVSKPSAAAKMSVLYITAGALTDVWSGVWYGYLRGHPPSNETLWYWCWGFLLTGATLLIIGLALGQIGRAARHAELPLEEMVPAEPAAAAVRAPVATVGSPSAPIYAATSSPGPMAIPVAPMTVPRPPTVHRAPLS